MTEHEYTLVITKLAINPAFDEELAQWEKTRGRGFNIYESEARPPEPVRSRPVKVLEVTVTAETFDAIRKAAVETL